MSKANHKYQVTIGSKTVEVEATGINAAMLHGRRKMNQGLTPKHKNWTEVPLGHKRNGGWRDAEVKTWDSRANEGEGEYVRTN